MLRPIEKIGLYILFAMLTIMTLILLTEVVWGHETLGTGDITFGPSGQHRSRIHVHAGGVPASELTKVAMLTFDCYHVHYVIDETFISGEVKSVKKQVLCYSKEQVDPSPDPPPDPEPSSMSDPEPDPQPTMPLKPPLTSTPKEQNPVNKLHSEETIVPLSLESVGNVVVETEEEEIGYVRTGLYRYSLNLHRGLNMFSLPFEVFIVDDMYYEIETLGEFYNLIKPFIGVRSDTGELTESWVYVNGERIVCDENTEILFGVDRGFFFVLKESVSFDLIGVPWENQVHGEGNKAVEGLSVNIVTGRNMIGIPLNSNVSMASDLINLIPSLEYLIISNKVTSFYVYRKDDSRNADFLENDISITGDEAFFLRVTEPSTLFFSGEPWGEEIMIREGTRLID